MSENERATKLLFDVSLARRQEAERRLRVLGPYIQKDLTTRQLREFAQERFIPPGILAEWKRLWCLHGLDGLLPQDWMPLTTSSREMVEKRFTLLGPLVDATVISSDDIDTLVSQMTRSAQGARRRAEFLIHQYQIGGVWGLAPGCDPEKTRQGHKRGYHNMSERVQKVIAGLRLAQPDLPLCEVHVRACQKARILGESEPSLWQVRYVCSTILRARIIF